jgi:hypothetical protein
MKTKKQKNYPKELFVIRENEGSEDEYLNTTETAEETAELGKKKRVARYVLEDVITVEGKAIVVSRGATNL